ncbi:N-acetylmuramoyl-L-alanine amidase [Striga asiatica]|uniref:N-acetylmuramoyl-L-alanine amidase n=1 Tax=Striga asiatica TaxID=4170 RepID=A0A5A7PRQ9_STRAF|nr:N-acetylmuramoyl-L-alanine amidase [Striga asiatica]
MLGFPSYAGINFPCNGNSTGIGLNSMAHDVVTDYWNKPVDETSRPYLSGNHEVGPDDMRLDIGGDKVASHGGEGSSSAHAVSSTAARPGKLRSAPSIWRPNLRFGVHGVVPA